MSIEPKVERADLHQESPVYQGMSPQKNFKCSSSLLGMLAKFFTETVNDQGGVDSARRFKGRAVKNLGKEKID